MQKKEGSNYAQIFRIFGGGIGGNHQRLALSNGECFNIVRRIVKDPEYSQRLYVKELGHCIKCGRELTNEESREIGIGPECRKDYAAAEKARKFARNLAKSYNE